MNNKKSTKRALTSSILSLVLCIAMLIGSTFAWFTDNVTSANNKIQSGSLKVDLELLDKDSNTWISLKENKDPIFSYENWEPGYTDVKILKVENEGTLALKWVAKFVSTFKLSDLANVIDVYVKEDVTTYPVERAEIETWTNVGTVANFVNSIAETTTGELEAGASETLGIALKMQESAGNEYQEMDLGGAFDIMIMATQLTSEEDSFNKMYDDSAEFTAEINTFKATLAAAQAGDTVTLNLTHDAYIGNGERMIAPTGVNIVVNGNGNTIYANSAAVVFGVKQDSNMTIKNVTILGSTTDDAIISQNNGEGTAVNIVMENVKVNLTNIKGINWPVCFGGAGNATITNCEITGAGLASGDYADGNQLFAGAQMNLTVRNSKIGSVMLNGNAASSATMNVDAASVIDEVILEAKNSSVVSGDKSGVKNMLVAVKTLGELAAAVKNSGANVFDAQGKSLGDFEYSMKFTDGMVLRNAKFTYFYGGGVEGTVTFENCEFVSDHSYSANFDNGDGNIIFNNCLFDGWSSFGTAIKNVEMNNCTFNKTYNYGLVRFYQNAQLNNCAFADNFEGVDTNQNGTEVHFNNCTGIENKIFNNGNIVGVWYVDGIQITDVPSW